MTLRAPYPYFGGKSRAAHLIWDRFGDVANYVEPFAGSLAVLLARPTEPRIETVNDLDCHIANFWRAVQADPEAVAKWCDWPVNEADLHARHLWLVRGLPAHRERMLTEPDYFDAKIAGWWVWGICQWIGSGWCAERKPPIQIPHVGGTGRGVHRKLPHVGGTGRQFKRPLTGTVASEHVGIPLPEWIQALSDRLRRVRVCCGDWSRVLGPGATTSVLRSLPNGSTCGVLLDPPYQDGNMEYVAEHGSVSQDVAKWAIENGDNPLMRIALCGYEGEHVMPPDWECVPWKAKGGYGGQSQEHDNPNAKRERIWFSPHCLGGKQRSLF